MTAQTPRRRMPKAVVRVDAEARLVSGPPRSPPHLSPGTPPHFDRNFRNDAAPGRF